MSPYTKEALEAQIAHWKKESERQRKARITEGILGLFVLGALISFTIWYSGHVQAVGDKRWCEFLRPLDQRYQSLSSPDPDAHAFAVRLHNFTRKLHC